MSRYTLGIAMALFGLLGLFIGPVRADGPEWDTVTATTMYYQERKDAPCLMCIYRDGRGVVVNERNEPSHWQLTPPQPIVPGVAAVGAHYYAADWKKVAVLTGKPGEQRLQWPENVVWSERPKDNTDSRKDKILLRVSEAELRKHLPKNKESIKFDGGDLTFFEFPGHPDSHIRLVTGASSSARITISRSRSTKEGTRCSLCRLPAKRERSRYRTSNAFTWKSVSSGPVSRRRSAPTFPASSPTLPTRTYGGHSRRS
jgi:hypothetical protein